jgi:hypothetical protein
VVWIGFQSGWTEYLSQKVYLVMWAGFWSWVDLPFVSDHAPVVAQFDLQPFPMAYPFKLNPTWLNEGLRVHC